jgi:hypothetical protein
VQNQRYTRRQRFGLKRVRDSIRRSNGDHTNNCVHVAALPSLDDCKIKSIAFQALKVGEGQAFSNLMQKIQLTGV